MWYRRPVVVINIDHLQEQISRIGQSYYKLHCAVPKEHEGIKYKQNAIMASLFTA